jgi:dienelactone hydrolase
MAASFGIVCSLLVANPGQAITTMVTASLDEKVVMIPAISGSESVQLETTIFKPPGEGPFPLVVMNHGKAVGNPHQQTRDRFIVLSREFVKRGYAVVIPMRKGFARSSGNYSEYVCDMERNGKAQADDLQAALNYLGKQSWVDRSRILVAGQSYGGLTAMAFAARGYPGVKGVINFAGGLRIHGGDCRWQSSLISAFRDFGRDTMVPSLWFYGANDSHFSPELAQRMHRSYVRSGGNAKLVAYGTFKQDAHAMVGSWDGVKVWWPETENFLRQIGMPADEIVVLNDDNKIQKTDFAAIDNIEAVPFLKDNGREAYRDFLTKSLPRAFAVSPTGAWSWAEDGDDPVEQVLANCEKQSPVPCKLYAVNDSVVWSDSSQMAGSPKLEETTGK